MFPPSVQRGWFATTKEGRQTTPNDARTVRESFAVRLCSLRRENLARIGHALSLMVAGSHWSLLLAIVAFSTECRIFPRLLIVLILLSPSSGCEKSQPALVVPEASDAAVNSDMVEPLVPEMDQRRREPRDDDWFEDVTQKAGVDFAYHSGRDAGEFTMVETFGGGVALFDYDLDGDVDVLCLGGGDISRSGSDQLPTLNISGRSPALFRNDGDWKFVNVTSD
ncbi:MAG: hypothetical protein HQ518_22640, partial [Rhodopirellula sp.]|nr:hypothetical protein [Rhodopirellula sp.]